MDIKQEMENYKKHESRYIDTRIKIKKYYALEVKKMINNVTEKSEFLQIKSYIDNIPYIHNLNMLGLHDLLNNALYEFIGLIK